MKPILLPPTRIDVVKETLRRSTELTNECGAIYTIVSYDLAIAKLAKQIQSIEHPLIENTFIQFGQFHTECNIFSALGKLIEGSGGPYILAEAGIVAVESINRFLKGKMYNRCRRGHILLSSALHALHFIRFINDMGIEAYTINQLKDWNRSGNEEPTQELIKLACKYHLYMEKTRSGELGKTAQFWMQYCRIIELYLVLHRAIKINDIELYAFSLYQLTSIFFMTNHSNYARWMTYYSLELWNLKSEKPDVARILENELETHSLVLQLIWL